MAERHRNLVEKEPECNDVSATDRSWPFQQARKKAKPRSGRRKLEHRDEVSEVNEGTRRKKRADLSDCTTDAGSHSDLDKDAAGQRAAREDACRVAANAAESPRKDTG